MSVSRAAVDKAIDDAILELLTNEIRNVYGETGVESVQDQRAQLALGFDRLIAFEALALEVAAQKFKD